MKWNALLNPLGVSKTRGEGSGPIFFFSKNAVLGLGLGLVSTLTLTLTLTRTLRQYSFKKTIDPGPGPPRPRPWPRPRPRAPTPTPRFTDIPIHYTIKTCLTKKYTVNSPLFFHYIVRIARLPVQAAIFTEGAGVGFIAVWGRRREKQRRPPFFSPPPKLSSVP